MRKLYKSLSVLLLLVLFAGIQTIKAQVISNTTATSTYTEGGAAITLHPNFTVTGGSGFGGGYMLFDLTNGSLGDQLGIKSDANPNAVGAISVSGSGIFMGNGTGTTIIGSIDGVMNGQNGQKLKINFSSNFSNPSFETGLTGWTTGNTQVKLGSTVLAGFTTPSDPTNPSNTNAGDTHVPQSATYTATTSTSEKTNGTASLWLYSTMTTQAGCDVVHGPYAISAPFQSNAGDVLSFDWRALGGNDAYDVFCYIVNTTTGVSTIILNQTGANASAATPWATATVTVPATGTYRFVFVSGTWDQTCGLAAGASLYVDNVKVFGNNVTPDIISEIAKRVTYQNNCGTSAATRNLNISLVKQDNSTVSTSSTITLNTFAPVAAAQNITVALAANGQVTVAGSSVNNGSTDNCAMTFTLSQSVFTCANLGATPVVLTVKDTYGNTSTANAVITVIDNTAPIITCPGNLTVNNTPGQCGATVTFNATVTDNCTYTVSYSKASGSFFPRGATPVTVTAVDGSGNSSQCTFTVTVNDNERPVANLASLPTITGQCSATVTTAPTATDNCSGNIVGTTTSPTTYTQPGTYTITWNYNDGNGNIATQTQQVVITQPEINLVGGSGNIAKGSSTTSTANNTDFGSAVANTPIVKTFTIQNTGTVVLNVSSINISGTDAANFTLGGITLPATVAAGQSLTFNVTFNAATAGVRNATVTVVNDDCDEASYDFAVKAQSTCTLPSITGVNPYIQQSTQSSTCDTTVTYNLSVTGAPAPSITYAFTGATTASGTGTGSGSTFNKGITHVTVTATNTCGTTTASFDVTIVDNVAPVAIAKNITVYLGSNGQVTVNPSDINNGSNDNCGPVTLSLKNKGTICGTAAEGGTVFLQAPAGTVIKSIDFASYGTPTGSCGSFVQGFCHATNSKSLVESYALNNNSASIPANNNLFGDPCGGTVKRLYVQATWEGGTVQNTTFNCSNIGNNNVTLTVTDAAGNTTTATAVVTVRDTTSPVITAPAAVNVNNTINKCGATLSITAPAATDNCTVSSVTGVRSDAKTLTADYPVGTTTITWTATDASGNTQTATQTITVTDTQKPTVTPVAVATRSNDAGDCGANVTVPAPVVSDNCGVQTITNSYNGTANASGHYPLGTTTITWTVTDVNGNTQTATQNITVVDSEKPVFTSFPSNITINALNNNCSNLVSWTKPTASDNCGVASIVSSDAVYEAFGYSLVPVGTTTVTYTVTDVNGNQLSRSFTITVVDNQPPVITGCPSNITVNAATGQCGSVVNWNPPTASDNCPGVSLSTNHVSGETFPVGTTTVTYTATDHAGLQTTCSFTVTVVDNQKPVLIGVPQNATVECNAVPQAATVTATDNCTPAVAVVYNETRTGNGECASSYTLTRTWTATDAAGNTATAVQTITVQDTQAPVLSAAPANVTVECNAVPAPAVLTAADNCTAAVTVVFNETRTNGNCPSNYTLTRTWTATDECGNTSSKTQVITVQDTQAPVLSAAPANATVSCDAVPQPAVLTATDNCDANSTVVYNEVRTNGSSPSNYTLTRTWTATDACGNASSKTQVITVRDTQAPVISAAPADVTVECNAVPAAAVLTASDNCDATVTVVYNETRTNGDCPSRYTLTRTWTATDASGNTSSKTQIITVQDTQAPVLSAAPADVTVECSAVPTPAVLTATDNCGNPVVVFNETRTNGDCPSRYTLTRTWTATDACGNTSSKTQVIVVQDTQAPVLSAAPADAIVSCDAVPQPAVLTATDNCDANSIVVYNEVRTNGNSPSNYTLTRTWTATDACGNTSSKTQILTVRDTQAPVISAAPADATVECNAVPAPAVLTANDNCDATVTVVYNETRTNGDCPSRYTLTRTWTATDASGNASTKTQVITVQDTQAPVLSAAPADATVSCDAVPQPAVLTATDNCDMPVVVYNETRTNGNSPSNYILTRTWTATDACGNTSSKTQIITVRDTQAPVISAAPADTTVECDAVPVPAVLTATDNCDAAVNVVYAETRTNGDCPSRYTLTRTWTATDASGNVSSKTQLITVQDTQAPVLSAAPANATVECNAVPAPAVLTATDNCDAAPIVTYVEVRTNGNCASNYVLTRTWTAIDACGNTSSQTQVITVQDTQAPTLSAAPADATVECDAVPAPAVLTATDNCDTPVVVYNEVRTNGSSLNNYTLTRTWTATDACGNTSSKTQVITVQDTKAPVITTAPANVTVECNAVPQAAVLTATDNCDESVTVVYNETRTNGDCPSRYTLTRTWTATDASGNTSTQTQVITVQDTQAPVISAAPADATVECDAVPAPAVLTATDNCDTPVVVYNEVRTNGNSPYNYTLTRTWTATDACGNTSSKTQVINVHDTKAPVISAAPADATVECDAVPQAAVLTATDNCDETVTVVYNETRTNGDCPSRYTLTRTWTATDAGGNTSSKTQVITVQDTKKPILTAAPANVTVACDAVPTPAVLTATDNCDAAPVVTYHEVRTNGTSPFNYTLTRTWTATDACGNTCSKTQVITVRDTQAPVPTIAVLPTLTGDCSVTATAPTANDNCAGTITATTLNPTSYTAQGVYTITWIYDDGQGNTSTQQQRVVVKDQSGPIPTVAVLPTVTGQCAATVTVKPTATDECSGITAQGTTTDPLSYNVQGTYTIHWTYTDSYGNQTIQEQTVIVKDNVAPVPNVASLPVIEGQCSVNITMITSNRCTDNCRCCRNVCHCRNSGCNCHQWGEWLSNLLSFLFGTSDDNHGCDHDDDVEDVNNTRMQAPTATDNCKGTIVATTTDPLSYNTQGTYTIHWKFDDGNGNITIQEQTVKVADVEAPVPTAYSLPTVYGTCSATVTTRPTAKDNCAGTVTGTTTDPLSYSTQGTYTIHWTFSDGHGNTSTQNQAVVINDNTKPVLTEPRDVTISCNASTLPSATGMATATDNCGTPVITYTDVTNGNRITRTWKATDAAGNYVTDVQYITLTDNTKPVITAPSAVTVNCGSSTQPSATGTATATDNCSTPNVTYSDNTNGYVITRTWKATDAAGNYATATQTITIVDNVKPTITAPGNVTVNCGSSTAPASTGTATAADNCSSVSLTYSDMVSNNVITRTWKATDASGNYATATQTITIVDNTKPVIADIRDITISCGASTAPSSCGGIPNAYDNCSTPTVTYSDVQNGNLITRSWTATDAAGNFATSTQLITIVDNTKPVLTEPNDITINCNGSTLPSATGMATATDNCSTPTVTYSDVQNGNVITRTWKATDASGNYATDVQYITIGAAFTAGISSVPTNNTYTGGVSTNLYLGYGAQSTTLQMCNLPSSGAPYTFVWSGTASNRLSSTTTASPVFTPTTFGYYTFSVTVANKYGCTSSTSISICVTDVRVPGTNGTKVYVCHTPSGKNKTPQTLQLALNQVAAHIGTSNCGSNGDDRLGSCDQSPCNTTVVNTTIVSKGIANETATGESIVTTEEDLKVTVMPNPTTTYFTLKLESKYDVPVNLRVMDASGRVIDAKTKIGANGTIQVGHNYAGGTYYAELTQGNRRKVVQMIKGKG